jgi:hypothetical protein
MVNSNRFYTYAYLREDKTPYYIGKGSRARAYRKNRRVRPPKDESRIILLKQNLTEEEAFKHEIYMIAVFGRKDLGTGILHNRSDGGEGNSGWVPSEETRRKKSERMKGKNNPNYGKSPSEETRKKQSESLKGKNNPFYGKKHSEETKKNWSEKRKGKKHSEETKKNWSEQRNGKYMGENNCNYGKKIWNDGCGNITFSIECPEEGWVPGRGEEMRKLMSIMKWWNDGCGNTTRAIECPGEGWVPGRGEEHRKKLKNMNKNPSKETIIKMKKAKENVKWWNDNYGNTKLCTECPGEGWKPGRK